MLSAPGNLLEYLEMTAKDQMVSRSSPGSVARCCCGMQLSVILLHHHMWVKHQGLLEQLLNSQSPRNCPSTNPCYPSTYLFLWPWKQPVYLEKMVYDL